MGVPSRIKSGSEVELTIERIGDRGSSIARVDGYVILVRGGAPGDRVRCKVFRSKRSFAEATVLEVLEPGPSRVEPRCRYVGNCGGCSLQHIAYSQQLKAKKNSIASALKRDAGLSDIVVRDPLASPNPYYYRNKMEFSFSAHRWLTAAEIATGDRFDKSFALGLHARGQYLKVVDIQECFLQSETGNSILCGIRTLAQEHGWAPWNIRNHTGWLRHLVIRETIKPHGIMVNLVTSRHDPGRIKTVTDYLRQAHPAVVTLINTINDTPAQTAIGAISHVIFGPGVLHEHLGPYRFEITPGSFFQTNTRQAEVLCEVVHKLGTFSPDDFVLDLYCGIGTFAIYIASSVDRVVGIELVPEAVEAARRNAVANGISNCTFIAGDMLKLLTPAYSVGQPDVVVIDPPRAGMHPKVTKRLAKLRPPRIVYVSCNPRSQARDLSVLHEHYRIEDVQPVDLFPQTHHIENVALLVAR